MTTFGVVRVDSTVRNDAGDPDSRLHLLDADTLEPLRTLDLCPATRCEQTPEHISYICPQQLLQVDTTALVAATGTAPAASVLTAAVDSDGLNWSQVAFGPGTAFAIRNHGLLAATLLPSEE